jgi:hypothetical protein
VIDPQKLAIPWLYAQVEERFHMESTNVPMTFGWKEPPRNRTGSQRIVWVPGDPVGSLGAIAGARGPGGNPRPLATLQELFTVLITGYDAQNAESEIHQYAATRLVYDAWYRAVHLAAHGVFQIVSSGWVVDRSNERRLGATLRVVASIEAMIPDRVQEVAPVDTDAEIDVESLDHSETVVFTGEA